MEKLKTVSLWAIINGSVIYLSILGIQGNVGAGRVAIFLIWFGVIMGFMALGVLSKEAKVKLRDKGRSVSAYIGLPCDIFLTLLFVYHGWWITGIACVLSAMFEGALYHKNSEEKNS